MTAVPDDTKDEKLIVLVEGPVEGFPVVKQLLSTDMPNLLIPKAGDFFSAEQIPAFSSGKLDLRGSKALAASLVSAHIAK